MKYFERLSERDHSIIRARLDSSRKPETLKVLAEKNNLSRERIRQIVWKFERVIRRLSPDYVPPEW